MLVVNISNHKKYYGIHGLPLLPDTRRACCGKQRVCRILADVTLQENDRCYGSYIIQIKYIFLLSRVTNVMLISFMLCAQYL
jgi:hypothetical protein